MKFSTLIPASLFALLLAACGGPEGTYKLDKDAMKKSLEAETKDKDAAGFAAAMVEAMDISLELKSDGTVEMKSSMKLEKDKPAKEETETGKWTKDGDTITLSGGKDNKDLKCKLVSGNLECESGEKGAMGKMVFKKS